MLVKNCPNCGGKLENGDRFCCWCGYVLPSESAPAPAPVPESASGSVKQSAFEPMPAPATGPVKQSAFEPVPTPASAPAPAEQSAPAVASSPAPAPAPVPAEQSAPAPAPAPVPAAQPEAKPAEELQSAPVQGKKAKKEPSKADPEKKISYACVIGFSISSLMALFCIIVRIWDSASKNLTPSLLWVVSLILSIVVFLVTLIISIAGLVSAKKKKKKLWGFGIAGIVISALGEAAALFYTILIAATIGLVVLIGGALADKADIYTGKEKVHGDFLIRLKSHEEDDDGSALTWYWDGDPDNNYIDVISVDGIKLRHLGEEDTSFTIKLSDDVNDYYKTDDFKDSLAADSYDIEEDPSYFGIKPGTEVTFAEIEFRIHIGKNVEQVVVNPKGADRYMAIVNEDGSITIYKYYVAFACDERNKKFYSDFDVLYLNDEYKHSRIFNGLEVDSSMYLDHDIRITPVPTPVPTPVITDTDYTEPDDPYYDDNKFIITYGSGAEKINLWSYTTDVPSLVGEYIKLNPEFGEKYTVCCTVINETGVYKPTLDNALVANGDDAPDIYIVEDSFAYRYTQGDLSRYAAPYKDLGIDVDNLVIEAEIAPYVLDVGTCQGEIVGLSYESCSGAMIYRASIARKVFGTDDPAEIEKIIGAGSGDWDKFMEAAAKLGDAGYPIVSTNDDLWYAIQDSSSSAWVRNGELVISPEREKFLDLSKELRENNWDKDELSWTIEWFNDMNGTSSRNAFCFFGPSWFVEYILTSNAEGSFDSGDGTFGDWRVCRPPVGFNWSGTWVLANKYTDNAEGVADLLEWLTLDCSETGCQYLYYTGLITNGTRSTVPSNTVMRSNDWRSDLCGGQDLAPVFADCNTYTSSKHMTEYDSIIDSYWKETVDMYADGEIDRDGAIDHFIVNVMDNIAF